MLSWCEEWRGRGSPAGRHASQVANEERFSSQTAFAVLLCKHDKCFALISADSIPARKYIPLCLGNEFTFVPDKRLPMWPGMHVCDRIVFLRTFRRDSPGLIGDIEYRDHREEVLIFALYDFCK